MVSMYDIKKVQQEIGNVMFKMESILVVVDMKDSVAMVGTLHGEHSDFCKIYVVSPTIFHIDYTSTDDYHWSSTTSDLKEKVHGKWLESLQKTSFWKANTPT